MPTISVPAYYASGQERWDSDTSVDVWSARGIPYTNRYGKRSYFLQPLGGESGLMDPLTHESTEPGDQGNWGGHYPGISWWGPFLSVGMFGGYVDDANPQAGEGPGHFIPCFWFRDLGIPRGATITSASLRLFVHTELSTSNANPDSQGWDGSYPMRVFGLAEDDAKLERTLGDAARVTYMNRYFRMAQGNALRFMEQSWFDDRECTQASVPWDFMWSGYGGAPLRPAGTALDTPDLTPIVQEIVNRPGWEPNNALALVTELRGWQRTAQGSLLLLPTLQIHGVRSGPAQYHPKLTVTF